MDRIKDLSGVILKPDAILAEVFELQKSNIILPGIEKSPEALDYLKVISVGEKVTDIKKGYYILDMIPGSIEVYEIGGVKYGVLYRGNIRIAVPPENFEQKDVDSGNLNV